jgi:galactose mutarotase-like enzyme
MHSLENSKLKISVNKIGAELCRIESISNNKNFMWHADPDVWENYAPNLFPIIGALKNDTYIFENQEYKLPKHGFIRNNPDIVLHNQTIDILTFKLSFSEELLHIYLFKFEYYITYQLTDNHIKVTNTIKNYDTKTMYFSVGAHPAFKCPVYNDERYDDYTLEFEHNENSERYLINLENGLISSRTKPVFNNSNQLPITHELFNEDALVFKDLKSRKVTLKSKLHGPIISMQYEGFPYMGIWAKPNGNYVCIEPWLGIADSEDTNQDLKTKEGVLKLDAGKTFEASYTIEIHNSHLA